MKGRTKWFKTRDTYPVRPGVYECGVLLTLMQRKPFLWQLAFDGKWFLCPAPMRVHMWRGLTKKEHDRIAKESK